VNLDRNFGDFPLPASQTGTPKGAQFLAILGSDY